MSKLKKILKDEYKKSLNIIILKAIVFFFFIGFLIYSYNYYKNNKRKNNVLKEQAIVFSDSISQLKNFYDSFPEPKLDDTLTNFVLKNEKGEIYNSKEFENIDRLYVFQSTNCPACLILEPKINEIEKKGVTVITIGLKEDTKKVIKYKEDHNINRLWLIDENLSVTLAFRVDKLPKIFLIDKNNKLKIISNNIEEVNI